MKLREDKEFIDFISKTECGVFINNGKFIDRFSMIDTNAAYQGLNRFIEAQNDTYQKALEEIKNGRKETHWMWFIFPQRQGLGYSDMSLFYGIRNNIEAESYLKNEILSKRLLEITQAVLDRPESISYIFGQDDIKFKSSMELFSSVSDNIIFQKALHKK